MVRYNTCSIYTRTQFTPIFSSLRTAEPGTKAKINQTRRTEPQNHWRWTGEPSLKLKYTVLKDPFLLVATGVSIHQNHTNIHHNVLKDAPKLPYPRIHRLSTTLISIQPNHNILFYCTQPDSIIKSYRTHGSIGGLVVKVGLVPLGRAWHRDGHVAVTVGVRQHLHLLNLNFKDQKKIVLSVVTSRFHSSLLDCKIHSIQ